MILCQICNEEFENLRALGIHRKNSHPGALPFCLDCKATFPNRQALCRHRKICEELDKSSVKENDDSTNVCGHCYETFRDVTKLCSHLEERHDEPASIKTSTFASEEEFELWKTNVETEKKFEFVSYGARRSTKAATVKYFRCHRSGLRESVSLGLRAPKKTGSIKVNFTCSTFAVVSVLKDTGSVEVRYCIHHYGHDNRMCRIHLPECIRAKVGQYTIEERSVSWILKQLRNDFRSSAAENEYQRLLAIERHNIMTRKDVANIQSQLGLRTAQKDSNDYVSVDIMVQEDKQNAFQTYFCYHPQGQDGTFTIGIQTAFQLKMLTEFGKRAICVDATHGTQKYKFLLVTVLVVDDFGKGVPTAWFITTNENEILLVNFFRSLRERTGAINSDVFMSDAAPQFWKAWISAYGVDEGWKEPRKLLCTWHVLKNWKKNVQKMVSNKDAMVSTYAQLHILLSEPDQASFQNYLSKFLTEIDQCEPVFATYFRNEYLDRDNEWAMWARKGSVVNVNMFIEAFHRVLKEKFLKRKENRRMDELLEILLQVAAWYLQEYHVSCERDGPENSYRRTQMHKRHTKSIDISDDAVTVLEPGSWKIQSQSDASIVYSINLVNQHCPCRLRCSYCQVCPDQYDCSCADARLKTVACKHIHFVHERFGQADESAIGKENDNVNANESNESSAPSTSTTIEQFVLESVPSKTTFLERKAKFRSVLESAYLAFGMTDEDAEDIQQKMIERVQNVATFGQLYSRKEVPLVPVTSKAAPNRLMATQSRFFQTRKRRLASQPFSKPTDLEIVQIKKRLNDVETKICAFCHSADLGNEETLLWVQCDNCEAWFHGICVNYNDVSVEFLCEICLVK